MKYEICEAVEGNLDEVFELWKKLMEEHKQMDPVFFSDIDEGLYYDDIKEHFSNPWKTIFVSICEGKVIGFLTAYITYETRYNSFCYCIIGDIMVDSQYRKEGIGKSLIENAKNWARLNDAERISLNVIHKNTKGYSFFKKQEFQDSWHILEMNL